MNKRWLVSVLALMFVLLGTGCTSTHSTYTFYNELEARWLTDCQLTPPPGIEEYKLASADVRAAMMANAYHDQLRATGECNAQFESLRAYNNKTIEENRKERARFDKEQAGKKK